MSGLFISATGILNALRRQDVTANNVANLATPGFRASRADSVESSGGGAAVGSITRDASSGNLLQTGSLLDAASARGFFQVTQADGTRAFTLAGNFGLNANGEIVTSDGARLEPPIALPPGSGNITVASDGTVFASGLNGEAPREVGRIEVFEFPNAEGLESIGGNLFVATEASGQPVPVAPVELQPGTLQSSNVDLTTEAVNTIVNRNAFQANAAAFRAQADVLGELLDLRE